MHQTTETGNFHLVANKNEIEEKSFKCFVVGGVAVVIARFRDEYFAFENRCSHALASFDDGRLRAYRIMCPLHGATFDIRDGSCTGGPASLPIRSFSLRLSQDQIEIDLNAPAPPEPVSEI